MSDIRVTFTGFISFFLAIIIMILGYVFNLILTRTLGQEEIGFWQLITGITQYVMIFSALISYWSTRDIARKINSGKTAIFGSTIFSIIAMVLYIVISYFVSGKLKIDLDILYFSVILIPVIFFNGILSAITLGWKPHATSYGLLGFSLSQLLFATLFIYFLHMHVLGIIITNLLAQSINAIILFKYSRQKIIGKLNLIYIKKWLKLSWLSLYSLIPNIVGGLEISIFSIITGSIIGLSVWYVVSIAPSIINQSGLISKAVYPKLLEGSDTHYLRDNISQLFFFNFMLTGIVVVFAKPVLYVLNPIYVNASLIVIILAISHFFMTLSGISVQNLVGNEKVDHDEKATLKNYMRSKLVYTNTLALIQSSSYVLILIIGFIFLINSGHSITDLLIFWALAVLSTNIIFFSIMFPNMIKTLHLELDYKSIMKYFIIAMAAFTSIFVIIENYLVYENNLFTFIPRLVLFSGIGIFFYITLAYVTDKKTRQLVTFIINEIKPKRS